VVELPGVRVAVVVWRTADVNALISTSLVEALLIGRTSHLLLSTLIDVYRNQSAA